jgi:hypothetical protein
MSSNCVPIAIYLNKMYNVLQTCPYIFLHIPKFKFLKQAHPTNSNFLGTHPKIEVGAWVKTA